ncbi:MAG: methyltransferase domain-containing protein [Alphaproteobacteria bacterium]|nr:methyltransferase domain-containing protein [Alphaproteobacteria bacterium]
MAKASKNPILNKIYNLKGEPDEVRDAYKDWAATYEKDTVEGMGYVAPSVVADKIASLVEPSARLLDAGCGTGLAGAALAERGFRKIDGMDISPDMLDVAREKNVYGELKVQDMTRALDYPDGAYDAVACVGTFTHAHVGPTGFDELLRIVRPSGYVVATVHEDVWPDGYAAHFAALEKADRASIVSIEEAAYHLHGCRLCTLAAPAA